jgi:predicted 2-oxoglutarate/Fe(II)-dependent dioxygenase YbiX
MTNRELLDQLDSNLQKVKADREAHSQIVAIINHFIQKVEDAEKDSE